MWCGRACRRLAAAARRGTARIGHGARSVERELVLLAALALLTAGCWHWSRGLGLVVPGLVLLWLAIGPDVVATFRGDVVPPRKRRDA